MEVIDVRSHPRNKQSGFVSIEMLFAIIAFVVLSAIGTQLLSRHMDSQNYQIAAQQQQAVAEAAAKYLKDYFSTVVASATPTVPVQITVAMLRNTNYLPNGFGDTNAFGQTLLVLARSPTPNQLESIVITTGGESIDEIGTREIAENIGANGGFIPATNTDIVQGVRGGWQIALSNYGMNPGVGHTASALFLQDGALVNDYLYRNAIPGHPELNQMNTAINMNGKNVDSAGVVTAITMNASGNVSAANAIVTGDTMAGGAFRTTGDGGIYFQKWSGGWYMQDPTWLRSYGDKNVSTGGELAGGKVTSAGKITAQDRILTNEYISIGGLATEGTACGDRTLVAKSAVGIMLSCQQGVWKANQGDPVGVGTGFTTGIPGNYLNRITGGWSCPTGTVPNLIGGIQIGGCNPCLTYSCSKP